VDINAVVVDGGMLKQETHDKLAATSNSYHREARQ
jgi:hypothetical protein